MIPAPEFTAQLAQAETLRAAGRLREAEEKLQSLLFGGQRREEILRTLADLYLQDQQIGKAIDTFTALTEIVPDRLHYYARLGALLDDIGETETAISHYQRLLQRQPRLSAAYYNLALLYKHCKRYEKAVAAYEKAIRLGIDNVQEVYTNLGVLYSETRRGGRAMYMYDQALAVDGNYIPALFNKAGLLEESGQRLAARKLYEQILELHHRHWESLARLAYLEKATGNNEQLVTRLRQATADARDEPLAREGLYFALGKILDDTGQYEQAFQAYRSANELGSSRNPAYDRRTVEQYFAAQIGQFTSQAIKDRQTTSKAAPIFVCGMLRSGSTLVEQILGSHPEIVSGGELDLIPWLASTRLMPWPQTVMNASRQELGALAKVYLSRIRELFPAARHVTDKRPDNFLFLGLIKMLFPSARIVYTKRNPMDNCLSIYFQQLGGNLNYATDMENTAHYYLQHARLMQHWMSCFAGSIFTVDYDELVRSPEPVLRRLLAFLGLEWSDRCLNFSQTENLVQTASVWQVREALHTQSSGRWRNYAPYVHGMQTLFV